MFNCPLIVLFVSSGCANLGGTLVVAIKRGDLKKQLTLMSYGCFEGTFENIDVEPVFEDNCEIIVSEMTYGSNDLTAVFDVDPNCKRTNTKSWTIALVTFLGVAAVVVCVAGYLYYRKKKSSYRIVGGLDPVNDERRQIVENYSEYGAT